MDWIRCTLTVKGLDCPHEATIIRQALEGVVGVGEPVFDYELGRVLLEFEPRLHSAESLAAWITGRCGLKTSVETDPPPAAESRPGSLPIIESTIPPRWCWLERWTVLSGLALALGILCWAIGAPLWWGRVCYAATIAAASVRLIPKAWASLRRRKLDIHILIVLAVAGALVLGQWDEAATLGFLFGLSELLESHSLARARRTVKALLAETPLTAWLISENGEPREVSARSVPLGAAVLVRPGGRVPLDGVIRNGESELDQKAITGESLPVFKGPGDTVFAGTVNGTAALEIHVTGTHDQTLLARMIERVRNAQANRAPVERAVERFAVWYTPVVVALAVLVMVAPPLLEWMLSLPADWADWFARGLVVLVISCPCALVIATPVAIVSAVTAAARHGVLIKSGACLESVGRLKTLAFDKTGTLTRGVPEVVDVVAVSATERAEILRLAAALGDRGGHVVGQAIARHARTLQLALPSVVDFREVPGRGATATIDELRYHIGNHRYLHEAGLCHPEFHAAYGAAEQSGGTAVAVSAARQALGWIRLADQPRPEANVTVAELRRLGVSAVMLTGDNAATAREIASDLGIDEVRAELLPEEKETAVAELDRARGPAGMVGDGVNDLAALARAPVSIALGSTAAALDTADVVLVGEDLSRLPWLIRLGRGTVRRIYQNIALAIGIKVAVLILAVLGMANLWMAIAADMGTTLLVVANALRLLRR